jgi:hypothetical protein
MVSYQKRTPNNLKLGAKLFCHLLSAGASDETKCKFRKILFMYFIFLQNFAKMCKYFAHIHLKIKRQYCVNVAFDTYLCKCWEILSFFETGRRSISFFLYPGPKLLFVEIFPITQMRHLELL